MKMKRRYVFPVIKISVFMRERVAADGSIAEPPQQSEAPAAVDAARQALAANVNIQQIKVFE